MAKGAPNTLCQNSVIKGARPHDTVILKTLDEQTLGKDRMCQSTSNATVAIGYGKLTPFHCKLGSSGRGFGGQLIRRLFPQDPD